MSRHQHEAHRQACARAEGTEGRKQTCFCKAPLTSAVSKVLKFILRMNQRQMLWMGVDHRLDCSLKSFTVMPSEGAPSDVLGREWSPGTGWDTASEVHTHRIAAVRLQVQWKQSEESAWVT